MSQAEEAVPVVTHRDVRAAYASVRALDTKTQIDEPVCLFDDNLAAKFAALALLDALRVPYEASSDLLAELAAEFSERDEDGREYLTEPSRYRAEERKLLATKVDLDVEKLRIRASMVGKDALKVAPTDLLHDMGPFFVWDIGSDGEGGDKAGNRAERRKRRRR